MSTAQTVAPGFRRLFEPLTLGGFTIRNRIVNTTHGTGLGEERDLRYLLERARGGAGLMGIHGSNGVATYTVGPGPVGSDWDSVPPSPVTAHGIAYYDDVAIPYLENRAKIVQAEGAKCFAQVFHLGAAAHGSRLSPVVGPSAVPDPYDALVPHPLTEEEIEEIVFAFAHGVRRVRDAGVDAAEIHGAHGYLVHEFLSPYSNRREDRWGGDPERRLRFVREILSACRQLVGDFPIGIRLGADGDGEGKRRGLKTSDLVGIASALQDEVAYISVSGGSYSGFGEGLEPAYVSPWYREPGHNVPVAAAVKAAVDIPVLVTGRIADAAVAEGILADGSADMVGMVRALIADPDLPNKVRGGRAGEVRMCLGLSECHHIGPHRTPITCAVNASAAREAEMELVPAAEPKTVVVVGAGPAGMEAARVARMRGHLTYLCDSARELGGTPRRLAVDPNRRNLRDHAAYFETELKKLGVNLMLGNLVGAEDLISFAPDALVIATGGLAVRPQVPGISAPHVVTALDVLSGEAAVGPRAIVVAGLDNHIGAATTAELLVDRGVDVEYLSEHVDFAHGAEDATRFSLLHRLMNKGITVSMCHRLVSVGIRSAAVEQTFTGELRVLEDVTVVLACGLVPNDALVREVAGAIAETHVIGDALAPRRIMHATVEGARVGRLL
jgi:2,4-dienoyl-CoA reductase-like NADH-dependent reductase (Old Yellow Enzyme family)/thioredoxin reductase